MGKRGPAPTPTAVLETRDSWRAGKVAKQAADGKVEPKPERGRPVCPRWIPLGAKRIWRDLVPQLDEMGVLSLIDRNAVTRYCVLFHRWVEAEKFIQEHGTTFPVLNGAGNIVDQKAFPQVRVVTQLCSELGRLEREFGLTPSARTRILVEDEKSKERATVAGGFRSHLRISS